mmetsp:Transcript_8360/g.20129  ORF Transcript_8360/g.20129 Transcript_8360/m.20129 type:complete len:222 (+) Transcript_8360:1248-1913(+)
MSSAQARSACAAWTLAAAACGSSIGPSLERSGSSCSLVRRTRSASRVTETCPRKMPRSRGPWRYMSTAAHTCATHARTMMHADRDIAITSRSGRRGAGRASAASGLAGKSLSIHRLKPDTRRWHAWRGAEAPAGGGLALAGGAVTSKPTRRSVMSSSSIPLIAESAHSKIRATVSIELSSLNAQAPNSVMLSLSKPNATGRASRRQNRPCQREPEMPMIIT